MSIRNLKSSASPRDIRGEDEDLSPGARKLRALALMLLGGVLLLGAATGLAKDKTTYHANDFRHRV